jgi:prevent-host-death family protein
MKTIGVRELRQHASRYLEAVAAGESIEITDRGHPVARLVPITSDPWEDLINAGEVIKAARPMNINDLNPAAYTHSASETLERLRHDER